MVITPVSEEWEFDPPEVTVTKAAKDIEFVGTPIVTEPDTYTVSGVVVDLLGVGIAGVEIDFIQADESIGKVTTGADGKWSKSGLTGEVTVEVSAGDWIFEPGSIQVSQDTAGDPITIVGKLYGYSLQGVVLDEKKTPVPGVQLLVFEGGVSAVQDKDSIDGYIARVITDDDGMWELDGLNEIVTVVPVKDTYRFLPQVRDFTQPFTDVLFTGLSGLTTWVDGKGRIDIEYLDDYRVKLTAVPTDDEFSFADWEVFFLVDDPDDPASLVYTYEEYETPTIIVTLDGPVEAIAYFVIESDKSPSIMGNVKVEHSFPMALEEYAAPRLTGSSAAQKPAGINAPAGHSFVEEYAGEQRIVMFDFFDYDNQVAELEQAGWKVIDHLEILSAYLVEPDSDRTVYRQLDDLSGVNSVDRNSIVRPLGMMIPDDEYYPAQWHYQQIRLAQAWSITTGSRDIRIAVVDTGIDPEHPELKEQIDPYALENLAAMDFTMDQDGIDYFGHGTHVAGTIGAATNNGYLVSGVMWDVTIVPVKVFDSTGVGTIWTTVQGMPYAAGLLEREDKPEIEPVDVINMSYGGIWTKVEEEAVKRIDEAGVIMVASAGNNEPLVMYPAACEEVIAVGAVGKVLEDDPDGYTQPPLAEYSNCGSGLDLVAPGGAGRVYQDYVYSTYPTYLRPDGLPYAGSYGTSMACPHVTGVVGLMLANGIAKEDIKDVLQRTAMEIHLPTPNIYYGHGLVNAYWAVNELKDGDLRAIQGVRNGDKVVEIARETGVPLKGGQFAMDLEIGEYQFIVWLDVNKNDTIDAGDYYAETGLLDIGEYNWSIWEFTVKEIPFDLIGDVELGKLGGTAEQLY